MKMQKNVGVSLFLVASLGMVSVALAQQPVTYPDPGPPNAPVPTFVQETITASGCQNPAQNSSTSSSFATNENIYAPLFWMNGFPKNGNVGPVSSWTYPSGLSNVLTLANGASGFQGTVANNGTAGVYPATLGSGIGVSETYNISVSGTVVSEQWSFNVQDIYTSADTLNQNYFYTFNSSYDIRTGIQTYGVNFNLNQVESGNPNAPGCTFTTVVNETGSTTHSYYKAAPCTLSISTSSLPNGTANSIYPSQTLTATGGTPPLTWSVSGLPTGLVANAQTGIISGTPTQSGQSSVGVKVTDSLSCTATKLISLSVNGTQGAIAVNGSETPTDLFIQPSVTTSQIGNGVKQLSFAVTCLDQSGTLLTNCDVLVAVQPTIGGNASAGHDHDDSSRPIGGLFLGNSFVLASTVAGNTGNSELDVNYESGEVAGDVQVQVSGSLNGSSITGKTFTIHVGIDGLSPLAQAGDYVLTGETFPHSANHFALQSMKTSLQLLTIAYHIRFPIDPLLPINDTSLEKGGLFDINANWHTPHTLHRFGNDADIGSGNQQPMTYWVPLANRSVLLHMLAGVGLHAISEGESKCYPSGNSEPCSHWHVRP
jgi:Putative Ig domain